MGQQRAKNWQDEKIRDKAQSFNRRVEEIKDINSSQGAGAFEQKEIERLNKVVAKQQKITEFSKQKQEEANYHNDKR